MFGHPRSKPLLDLRRPKARGVDQIVNIIQITGQRSLSSSPLKVSVNKIILDYLVSESVFLDING